MALLTVLAVLQSRLSRPTLRTISPNMSDGTIQEERSFAIAYQLDVFSYLDYLILVRAARLNLIEG